jgi:hypothetical protein
MKLTKLELAERDLLDYVSRNGGSVNTVNELRDLPDGTILKSGDRIRQYDGALWRIRGGMVDRVGQERDGVTPFKYFVDPLPATVIYEPEERN